MHVPLFSGSIISFDIETVPACPTLDELEYSNPILATAWVDFVNKRQNSSTPKWSTEMTPEEIFESSAMLYPEFAKIACVSFAMIPAASDAEGFDIDYSKYDIVTKTLLNSSGNGEKQILEKTNKILSSMDFIAGHNIIGFDIPFICRRMLYNGIKPSASIDSNGKKPWELSLFDTMQIWAFGDWGSKFSSLDLICKAFDIPSPKVGFNGDAVKNLYDTKQFDTIAEYCERDTAAVLQVLHKYCNVSEANFSLLSTSRNPVSEF